MKKTLFTQCCLWFALFLLVGCALVPVHRPDIEQGNIITTDMAAQLKKGLHTQQVLNLLGTPILENGFTDATHWYYIYTFKDGKTGSLQRKYLVLSFRNNVVIDIMDAYPATPFH